MCKMEWSQEEVINLIDIYRRHEIIWDSKHSDHYNKIKKQDAWEEVAKQVDRTVSECKKKMDYLLAALRREKMKMKNSTGAGKGSNEVYKSSWFAYKSMQFLLDKNTPRSTLSTLQVPRNAKKLPEIGEQEQGKNATDGISEKPSAITKRLESPATSSGSSNIQRKKRRTTDKRLDKAFQILTSSASIPTDDSYHFGNLVADKLRCYDENIRCTSQSEIMNIFIRANRGDFNKENISPGLNNPDTSSSYSPLSVSSYSQSQTPNSWPSASTYSDTLLPSDRFIDELVKFTNK